MAQTPVTGTFTTTGESNEFVGKDADISIGTFTGTIALQRYMNGWVDVESYTGATEKVAESSKPRRWRLSCTTLSSGTPPYEIG